MEGAGRLILRSQLESLEESRYHHRDIIDTTRRGDAAQTADIAKQKDRGEAAVRSMEYLSKLNLSPKREALYRSIMLEEEIDEATLKLLDHPPIAEDIAAQTKIPLAVCRRLVDDARSEQPRQDSPVLPYSPPDRPQSPPACSTDSSSSSEDEDHEQVADPIYPRIRSPQALRQLQREIHTAVDEAAEAQTARDALMKVRAAEERRVAVDAAAALEEESARLMAELKKKNELQKQKHQQQV